MFYSIIFNSFSYVLHKVTFSHFLFAGRRRRKRRPILNSKGEFVGMTVGKSLEYLESKLLLGDLQLSPLLTYLGEVLIPISGKISR